jgi:hypothetical protein
MKEIKKKIDSAYKQLEISKDESFLILERNLKLQADAGELAKVVKEFDDEVEYIQVSRLNGMEEIHKKTKDIRKLEKTRDELIRNEDIILKQLQ